MTLVLHNHDCPALEVECRGCDHRHACTCHAGEQLAELIEAAELLAYGDYTPTMPMARLDAALKPFTVEAK